MYVPWLYPSATFEGSLEEQAEFMSEVGKHVNAPVVLTNQIASFEQVVYLCVSLCVMG